MLPYRNANSSVEQRVAQDFLAAVVRIEAITEREIRVLELRQVGCTLQEVGDKIGGVSRERARQIEEEALAVLRNQHLWELIFLMGDDTNIKFDKKAPPPDYIKGWMKGRLNEIGDEPTREEAMDALALLLLGGDFNDEEVHAVTCALGLDGQGVRSYEVIAKDLDVSVVEVVGIVVRAKQRLYEDELIDDLLGWGKGYKLDSPRRVAVGTPLETVSFPDESTADIADEFNRVSRLVAASFGVTTGDILGKSRKRDIVLARQVVMYFLHETFGISYPKIGAVLDRDHTTCLHAVEKIKQLIEKDRSLASKVERLLRGVKPEYDW
jgi:hypothetical protein